MVAYYLSIVRRRAWLVFTVAAIAAPAIFLALIGGPATYSSEAVIQVGSGDVTEGVINDSRRYEEPERRVATELEVLTGRAVAEGAAARLRGRGWTESASELMTRVEAAPRGGASAIEVVGTDTSAVRAQQLTAAFVDSYIDYRREFQREESERVRADLQRRLDAAAADGDSQRRYDTLAEWLEGVTLRLSVDTSGLQVISPPSLPEEPATAVSPAGAAIASVLGSLLLACALALAIDLFRDTVRTREDVEMLVPAAMPVAIPRMRNNRGAWIRALSDPADPTSSAARGLRLRLAGSVPGGGPQHILVVGTERDGRDTLAVATALAASYGRSHLDVLLVADVAGGTGFEGLVTTGPDGMRTTAHRAPDAVATAMPGVWLAQASATEDGALGFLDVPDPAKALDSYARSFRVVIVAVPAAADGAEAVAIAHLVEAVVVVCALGRTPAKRLRRLVASLERGGTVVSLLALTTKARRRKQRGKAASQRQSANADSWVATPVARLPVGEAASETVAEARVAGEARVTTEREERVDALAGNGEDAPPGSPREPSDIGWPGVGHGDERLSYAAPGVRQADLVRESTDSGDPVGASGSDLTHTVPVPSTTTSVAQLSAVDGAGEDVPDTLVGGTTGLATEGRPGAEQGQSPPENLPSVRLG